MVIAGVFGATFALAGDRGPAPRDLGGTCFGQRATILGTSGSDDLSGTGHADVILGFGGDDELDGGGGSDILCGGGGEDELSGRGGGDRLNGGRDDDAIAGGSGPDQLKGRGGDDALGGGGGNDKLGGGHGNDACDGGPGTDRTRTCETDEDDEGGGGDPNRAPLASDDTDSTDEATAKSIPVLANDTDADGDTLTVQSVGGSPTGAVTITAGGTAINYDPNGQLESLAAGATETVSFTYEITDGNDGTDAATVAITVNGTEDGPLAVNDSATLDEDAPATAVDVLSNDGDIDGGPVFVASKTNGAHGDVAITGGGTGLTYLPDADYCGPDSFTYTLNGGSTATVSITVTCVDDPGTAVDDSATVAEDSGATEIDVGTNDNDIDGSLITSVTQPANGTVEITGGGESVSYTPDLDFCSPPADAFTYTVQGGSTGTVTVTVDCQNDPPVNSVPEAQSPDEDNNLAFSFGNGNLIEVSDIDAGAASLEVTLTATHGTLSLSGTAGLAFSAGDGTSDATMTFTGTAAAINSALAGLTYDPDNNYNGPASLQMVTDDQGNTGAGGAQSDTDGVAITVEPVDDDPDAVDDTKTVDEDDPPTTVDVLANDTDVDGGPMTIDAVTQPANGTVVNNGSDLTYEPDDDYCNDGSPTDDFTYTLNGGSVADVEVTVDCENDAPVNTVPGAQVTDEDTNLVLSSGNGNAISTSDGDAGSDDLEVTLTATQGTVTLASTTGLTFSAGDGTADVTTTFTGSATDINAALAGLTYDPDDDYDGPASLQIVTDDQGNNGAGGAQTDTDSVAITVNAINDAPELDLDTGAGGTGSDATFEETDPHTGNGVQLAPIAEITDVDDTNIESASATLTNRLDGDAFESLAADAGATGITVGYTEETGLLELSGSEPIADYEQVLRSILYDNTDNPPDSADRLIDVVVNDGDGGSNTAVATVEVVPLI